MNVGTSYPTSLPINSIFPIPQFSSNDSSGIDDLFERLIERNRGLLSFPVDVTGNDVLYFEAHVMSIREYIHKAGRAVSYAEIEELGYCSPSTTSMVLGTLQRRDGVIDFDFSEREERGPYYKWTGDNPIPSE